MASPHTRSPAKALQKNTGAKELPPEDGRSSSRPKLRGDKFGTCM